MKTTMKLSEAIRLGAVMRPQAFGMMKSQPELRPVYREIDPNAVFDPRGMVEVRVEQVYSTCAWGAALDAIGILDDTKKIADVAPHWLEIYKYSRSCPSCGVTQSGSIIIHLNDWHMWPRERIADWVESIERLMESRQEKITEQLKQEQVCETSLA